MHVKKYINDENISWMTKLSLFKSRTIHVGYCNMDKNEIYAIIDNKTIELDKTAAKSEELSYFSLNPWEVHTTVSEDRHFVLSYRLNYKNLDKKEGIDNYWALFALVLVVGTAAGNVLVCLAIAWERRLQNVTNYFLMSLAITDLMVAILVMPLGILTLFKGHFPLGSEHCLIWICLDVLFCTASIMHLCTISVDRYLSLRYPMRFGRNKTRRRVTFKIIFVWLLSIAMSLPLSLMYSKDHSSVLVNGTCQIPDPVYKLVGSIICFYIPLAVMLLTYCLTIRLLARQRKNLGGTNHLPTPGWASGWLVQTTTLERKCAWRHFLKSGQQTNSTNPHSGNSTDTELSTLDTHEIWLADSSIPESTPTTMTALHQFGTEILKLSQGIESVTSSKPEVSHHLFLEIQKADQFDMSFDENVPKRSVSSVKPTNCFIPCNKRRRASTSTITCTSNEKPDNPLCKSNYFNSLPKNSQLYLPQEKEELSKVFSKSNVTHQPPDLEEPSKPQCYSTSHQIDEFDYLKLPPPCTCPYFGDRKLQNSINPVDVKIISSNFQKEMPSPSEINLIAYTTQGNGKTSPISNSLTTTTSSYLSLPLVTPESQNKLNSSKTASVVTWNYLRNRRRGSSFGGVRTSLLLTPTNSPYASSPLHRSVTLRNRHNTNSNLSAQGSRRSLRSKKSPISSQYLLHRNQTTRSQHLRNPSVISRNSSRHGRIIRLEQKATKVLGVVFFTFVILWSPFFVLNLLPTVCGHCEDNIAHWVFEVVTWLGYSSSMVNPIFYTIFNKVFRQAFKKVILCKYKTGSDWIPNR